MKIKYDNAKYNTDKQDWKVGDIIQNAVIGGGLFMVAEVATDDEVLYTLIDLEDGVNLACTNTIGELQQAFQDTGDRVIDGTFKYISVYGQGDGDDD
ncbi:hypothetical protein [Lactiplantibacillus plantarum]|uniref:hypothetical protein n=1 Tax=Lactiplantibacillus plantarum TaxID=1590 RepID=UPI000FF26202|nr:hypothetical protein [Lactiplantibacillus plantarum]QBA76785.1 hypothetical protein EVE91_04915 [Lactiplantibacillus plantarum]RWZ48566.1 hypothetical protein EQJ06_10540 [Lactiplantibacillus plantarum]RWZ70088.1 hypothetical protein EQH87_04935 [Lactiplantibacillus plantarum]